MSSYRLSSFFMEDNMTITSPEQNKALVLEAFDTLFNKRDYAAAERFWSERYIQHSAHIPPGRDGLFNLVRGLPETLRYENRSSLNGTLSSPMGGSPATVTPGHGSPPMSCVSKTASSPSTGMFFRTRRPGRNPLAASRCSAIVSLAHEAAGGARVGRRRRTAQCSPLGAVGEPPAVT
jgi:hypothetical protein